MHRADVELQRQSVSTTHIEHEPWCAEQLPPDNKNNKKWKILLLVELWRFDLAIYFFNNSVLSGFFFLHVLHGNETAKIEHSQMYENN